LRSLVRRGQRGFRERHREGLPTLSRQLDQTDLLPVIRYFMNQELSRRTSHGDAIKRSHSQELLQVMRKTCPKLQYNKRRQIDDHGPLPPISVRKAPKNQCANGSQHQSDCQTPRYLGVQDAKLFRDLSNGQRNGEEVERIPRPAQEASEEHKPLVSIKLTKHSYRMLRSSSLFPVSSSNILALE
jgi:hypothetical protein